MNEPIAVIGIGCRFPGSANSPSKLWELLKSPRNVASPIPKTRWNLDKFYHPVGSHHGTTNVTESYFLDEADDIRHFDSTFFGAGPAEAEAMDPQHRLLVEVVYEAMENGGFTLSSLHGSDTAVYVGVMCQDYSMTIGLDSTFIPQYAASGLSPSNASSRVSYYFNWHGPSMTIDTACSSSLVAVHQAVDHLRTGRSRVAVACGTNLLLNPEPYITESNLNMLSPTGRSRMWDADADGYARGDGVAAVILKRLSDAIADGDTIDGIVRNTGFGQDGRTMGITMPSGPAQASVIKKTYSEAGLDLSNKLNWPQFVEAHGTGTPVGDPQEASALAACFSGREHGESPEVLVGSIKTLVGHTEGTAGIAGLIKACLAVKNSEIPPNLLFNRLSPGVAPYYNNLRIPTTAEPWPQLEDGQPRRASVNSFGFGGTDAHAILESYDSPARTTGKTAAVLPFTFSAASDKALKAALTNYEDYLSVKKDVDLGDLGYTLTCRRSALPFSISITAQTPAALLEKIQSINKEPEEDTPLAQRTSSEQHTSYLGVFTGQGAQYARMGHDLLISSPVASDVITQLQDSLDTLPEDHQPSWTLRDELSASPEQSRISEAELSQPLCTAVQIILVELLRLAGIQFSAVVGHSSGEIGAAYAAGFLSANDAIRVAFYRGRWTTLLGGLSASGEAGSMIAAGTSHEDAEELCQCEDLEGRITVAAVNSPASVTLSGDHSAVLEVKNVFDEEGKFARLLRVDKAYHSHHMLACSKEYAESLTACGIEPLTPTKTCPQWYSSVDHGKLMSRSDHNDLVSSYWVRNMTGTVLFERAVRAALDAHPALDVAIEVGPHPALKSPALEVIKDHNGEDLPYFGTLRRGANDVEVLAELLGGLWVLRGPETLQLKAYQDSFDKVPAQLLSDLPKYAWDHDRSLWWEPRLTRNHRRLEDSFHDLLGSRASDGSSAEWRWLNWLKQEEIPWLSGHSLQGQVVFPAAGFLVMAMEAALKLVGAKATQLIELRSVDVRKALAIPNAGTETVVCLNEITWDVDDMLLKNPRGTVTANFTCSSPPTKDSGELVVNCACLVVVTLGPCQSTSSLFAPRQPPVALRHTGVEDFYDSLQQLGYFYEGPFRSVTSIQRKLDAASGTVNNIQREPASHATPLLLHPGMLDSALQAMFAAYSAPGDKRLWSLHAPRSIGSVRVVPGLCGDILTDELAYDAFITDSARRNGMVGDVDLYTKEYGQKVVEFQDLIFVPLSSFEPVDDRHIFAQYRWVPESPSGERALAETGYRMTADGMDKAKALERISFFYLRSVRDVLHVEAARTDRGVPLAPHRTALLRWSNRVFDLVTAGEHPYISTSWLCDDQQTIDRISEPWLEDADAALAIVVGRCLPDVIRNDGNIFEHMVADGLLDRYYMEGLGLADLNKWSANIASQIAQRYPQMSIIEIGAGTGGSTKGIVSALGQCFASYTFTDISGGFFEKAQQVLHAWEDRFQYRVLNVESSPADQGFAAEAYDMVVAANILHATRDLGETLRNTRTLMKPGAFLLAVELVDNTSIRAGFIQSGLEGWWIGAETGRPWAPTVTLPEWDTLLRANGYAGVETATPVLDALYNYAAVWVSRAVDDDFRILLDPLAVSSTGSHSSIRDLVLVGAGAGPHAAALSHRIRDLVTATCKAGSNVVVERVHEIDSLESLLAEDGTEQISLPERCTTLSLVELDAPIFKGLTSRRWEALKKVLAPSASLLWVTAGARNALQPYAAMTAGVMRTVTNEIALNSFQLLDVDNAEELPARTVAEAALRLAVQHEWMTRGAGKQKTWATESELALDGDDVRVLRVLPDAARNDRYNSMHRRITKRVPLRKDNGAANVGRDLVTIGWNSGEKQWSLTEQPRSLLQADLDALANAEKDLIFISIDHTILSSLHTPAGWLYLALGTDAGTAEQYVCLTPKQASTIVVPRVFAIPTTCEGLAQPYLSYVVAYLFCHRLFSVIPERGSVVLHGADVVLAGIFAKLARDRQVQFVLTSSDPKRAGKANCVYLHPRSTRRAISSALPRAVDVFVDLSAYNPQAEDGASRDDNPEHVLGVLLRQHLPRLCAQYDMSLLLAAEAEPMQDVVARVVSASQEATIANLLREANSLAMDLVYDIPDGSPLPQTYLNELSTGPLFFANERDLRIVTWTDTAAATRAEAEVEVEPVDRRRDLFRADETYWLVGLAGDLGRSVCDWMATAGARYIVLSSRNPQLPVDWVDEHRRSGVHIAPVKVDVTDFASLMKAKNDIVTTVGFPRIAGVANGAMILRDKPMLDTDIDTLQEVLKPKVQGTTYLDQLFSRKHDLDWFIVLTSCASVVGNLGQMAYSAANSFQAALVRHRRARGLCGTAVDVNMVVGVGYIERERASGRMDKHAADRLLNKSQLVPICEPDLYKLFAEAVLAGRNDQTPGREPAMDDVELITGLQFLASDIAADTFWAMNPKFSHWVRDGNGDQGQGSGDDAARVSLKVRLGEAKSAEDASKLIQNAMLAKLKFGLSMEKVDPSMPLVDFGVDSLVAVVLRNWSIQETGVDVPVLKILGGDSTQEIVNFVVERLDIDFEA